MIQEIVFALAPYFPAYDNDRCYSGVTNDKSSFLSSIIKLQHDMTVVLLLTWISFAPSMDKQLHQL